MFLVFKIFFLFFFSRLAYELWFKQIIYELDSIRDLFSTITLDESRTLEILKRLNRIAMILKVIQSAYFCIDTYIDSLINKSEFNFLLFFFSNKKKPFENICNMSTYVENSLLISLYFYTWRLNVIVLF